MPIHNRQSPNCHSINCLHTEVFSEYGVHSLEEAGERRHQQQLVLLRRPHHVEDQIYRQEHESRVNTFQSSS